MSITDRSRTAVAETLDRLEADHGAFEVVDKEWVVSPSWHSWTRERVEAGTLGGAGAWLRDDGGRVLLVRREGEDRWEEPGGKHEVGESLEETARREAREEAGVECELHGVAQAHRITVRCERDTGEHPPMGQLFVIFAGAVAGGEPSPREGEIETVRWWSSHPSELHYEELRRLPIPAGD
jgi:ADP-ribose pyrophosphatase YjhB (NUDIX family)